MELLFLIVHASRRLGEPVLDQCRVNLSRLHRESGLEGHQSVAALNVCLSGTHASC